MRNMTIHKTKEPPSFNLDELCDDKGLPWVFLWLTIFSFFVSYVSQHLYQKAKSGYFWETVNRELNSVIQKIKSK